MLLQRMITFGSLALTFALVASPRPASASCLATVTLDYPFEASADVPSTARLLGTAIPATNRPDLEVRYDDGAMETVTGTVALFAPLQPDVTAGVWTFTPSTPWQPGRPVRVVLHAATGDLERTFTATNEVDQAAPDAFSSFDLQIEREVYEEVSGPRYSTDEVEAGTTELLLQFLENGALATPSPRPGVVHELWLYPQGAALPSAPFSVGVGGFVRPRYSCERFAPCAALPFATGDLLTAPVICARARLTDASGNASPLGAEHCATVSAGVPLRYDYETHACAAIESVLPCSCVEAKPNRARGALVALVALLIVTLPRRFARR